MDCNKNASPSQNRIRAKRMPWHYLFLLIPAFFVAGCISYSFTGTSIPKGVNSIYIPFFANQTSSGVPDLSDRLNNALIDRFINQSSLRLANNLGGADAVLKGSIISYSNQPFSITGDDYANLNEVSISVRATYYYSDKEEIEWEKTFNGSATYDPNQNPIDGESNAAQEALDRVANNMFNDALSDW